MKYHSYILVSLISSLAHSSSLSPIELGYEYFRVMRVSGYTSNTLECDNTPYITASGYVLTDKDIGKVCACNRFAMGTILYIVGTGEVKVVDRMSKKYPNRIDLYFGSPFKKHKKQAKKWGVPFKQIWVKKKK